jgi:3'(2'), 5'-bisphosphate nucleotidase
MAVVRDDADIYLATNGQYAWDSWAPTTATAAFGLHVSRVDGTPLRYNQPDAPRPIC